MGYEPPIQSEWRKVEQTFGLVAQTFHANSITMPQCSMSSSFLFFSIQSRRLCDFYNFFNNFSWMLSNPPLDMIRIRSPVQAVFTRKSIIVAVFGK